MGRRFPGVFQWRVALPSDMELSVGSGASVGNDGFDGVFLFSLDFQRRRTGIVQAMFRSFLIGG